MNICIVGWYGTETLGDRAILDGILAIFQQMYGKYKIYLGSLYPFFTERTLWEDAAIYRETAPECKIELFNEKKVDELKAAIKKSDYICMGGGPLMDLYDLNIVRKAFKYARKLGKRTVIFGCGLGPVEKFKGWIKEILDYSDLIIFRDEVSAQLCKNLFGDKWALNVLEDPAIISVLQYMERKDYNNKKNGIAINFRRFPEEYGKNSGLDSNQIAKFLCEAERLYDDIWLIPMHTFFIGGDDRDFLVELKQKYNLRRVQICHKPLNLYELYDAYRNAEACVGMRYHSVVLQTILNGNNYILDYTNPEYGKIKGFLNRIPDNDFYNKRYYNMQKNSLFDSKKCLEILKEKVHYSYPIKRESISDKYCRLLESDLM